MIIDHKVYLKSEILRKTPLSKAECILIVEYGMQLNSGHAQLSIQHCLPPLTRERRLISA